jgi:hypothetical protein
MPILPPFCWRHLFYLYEKCTDVGVFHGLPFISTVQDILSVFGPRLADKQGFNTWQNEGEIDLFYLVGCLSHEACERAQLFLHMFVPIANSCTIHMTVCIALCMKSHGYGVHIIYTYVWASVHSDHGQTMQTTLSIAKPPGNNAFVHRISYPEGSSGKCEYFTTAIVRNHMYTVLC